MLGHLYILETPLFRVRNKKETIYCYSEPERISAIEKLKPKPEITRFKGLGEISPDEFGHFIGDDIRYIDRGGSTSPPFDGINLKSGDIMREDWFPRVFSS